MELKTYSNAETVRNVENWPFGSDLRTTAYFYVETHPKRGQRAVRRTLDPRNGSLNKPKTLTYAPAVRIMTGSDGKTYIVSHGNGSFYIMRGDMKFFEEAIYPQDPRYQPMAAVFYAAESADLTVTKEN